MTRSIRKRGRVLSCTAFIILAYAGGVFLLALVSARASEIDPYTTMWGDMNGDGIWDTNRRQAQGTEGCEVTCQKWNRKLMLLPGNGVIVHEVRPVNSSYLTRVATTEINPQANTVSMTVYGYFQTGRATFDLQRQVSRLEISSSGGRLISSEVEQVSIARLGDLWHMPYAFSIITDIGEELLLLDVVLDANDRLVAVRTSELCNYYKLFTATTVLRAGYSPAVLDTPPYVFVSGVTPVRVDSRVNVWIRAFDLEGALSDLTIDWHDATDVQSVQPSPGVLRADHRYRKPGRYPVEVTAHDNRHSMTVASYTITVVEIAVIEERHGNASKESKSGSASSGTQTTANVGKAVLSICGIK